MKPVATRLLVAGAIAASLALLVGAVMLVIRLAQPPDYQLTGRSPDGEIVGRVAQVESGVILVQSEVLGGTTVPLLLTKGTRIMVGNREGWLGDVSSGAQIKVAYELYEGKRLAQSVEVLDGEAARRPGPVEPPPSKAASSPKPVSPPSPPAGKAAVKPAPPEERTPPAPAAPARPAPAPPAPVVTQPPAPRAEPPPASRPRAPAAAPRPPEAPVRAQEPARPQEPPRPREGDSPDGSDAVDWLLKGRR